MGSKTKECKETEKGEKQLWEVKQKNERDGKERKATVEIKTKE